MYSTLVFLHSYNRWLVLLAMAWVLIRLGWGMRQQRAWTDVDKWTINAFLITVRVQAILGIILFFIPTGFAQAAWRSIGTAMAVRDLRFFGLEHPLQMFIAVGLIEMGMARAKKAELLSGKYRWAVIPLVVALLLILTAIPWWRPMLRGM